MLKDWGFSYDICSNGKLAIDKLKENNSYNLILMDIQMPEMNGYETTEFIRDQLKLTLPIIAMTAHASVNEIEACFSEGMNEYISKPFDVNDLVEKIKRVLALTNG